ncbi:ribonuclease T2 family protein [Oceanicola granulosus HTCC2516]|uniref:Ribonuclease T2 family protein n=1 Tax=Oceanicola granulosus (strain ATCC BAA-861 / DSM 15982 / KCTC 12143 / HTCC2516) TaxID=314256 RepID=Q2CA85_OCEGH|nr:ribonuclease T2 [Oceanicola granulosus]EAR49599.1 ribonuclease T2 family protein [Oceanicola granulosus HTCC2516]
MYRCLLSLLLLLPFAAPAGAQDRAGAFDYYVLALSWSPNWCAREGDAQDSPQCDAGRAFGWVVHGLWPQYERGWPDYCATTERAPSRSETAAMADLFGTSGSAWHQWRKHGVCSGLSSADYYALAREAFGRIARPEVFRKLDEAVTLPAAVVEEAFLADNPDLRADGITVTCRDGMIQEARICLTRDLAFRACGADVARDCGLDDALFEPIR